MRTNKILKVAYISIILFILIFTSLNVVFAATKTDLYNEMSSIEQQIEEKNSEIAGVKSKMTKTLTQINNLTTQINSYKDDISELESQLAVLNVQISEDETKIQELQAKFDEQQKVFNKRLVAIYESGSISYLDILLGSEGLADFISKYYLVSQLAEYDKELLKNIEDTKNVIQLEKDSLEQSKETVETAKQQIQNKTKSLNASVKDKNNLMTTLNSEEKELQEQLEAFEEHKKEVEAQIARLAKDSNQTGITVIPSAAGYICPIPGKTKRNITTGYYGYKGHTGVDFACSSGTRIVAVKSGKVVTSTAKKNSKGKYVSYGEYIIIDHQDGTMTLYAHGLAGSRLVKPGDYVTQGQQIMSVGSTGNSTGPHLHFEVFVGGKRTNPTSFLP